MKTPITPDKKEFKYLDKEEREIIDSIENTDDWVPVENFEEEKKKAQLAAQNTLERLKNKNINIRLSGKDIERIKERAYSAGLPYQTLIASILHQYATGKLKVQV